MSDHWSLSRSCIDTDVTLVTCRRKGLGEQVGEKMTPDSSKSTTDKISENVSGTVDKGMEKVQPGQSLRP